MKITCPYCKDSHVDTFPCKHAKAAGITKADLPGAYYTEPQKRTESTDNGKPGKDTGSPKNTVTTAENPETVTKRKWRENNRDRYNQYMREWKRENADKVREYQREYMRQRRNK